MAFAAWVRVVLSVLVIQPPLGHAAPGTPRDGRSRTARQQARGETYVVVFNWAQIQRLAPGTKVVVAKPGVKIATQYFLAATSDEVKTLGVSDMAVQFAKQLRAAAATHPEYFVHPAPAGTRIALDDHVSLKDAAVFVGERRVADLQDLIVTISRDEIDTGSATVSTMPIRNQLSVSAKILIGFGIAVVAAMVFAAIAVSNTN